MRGITRHTVLYTEMVVDETAIHSPNLDFFLGCYPDQYPSVVQLGEIRMMIPINACKSCVNYKVDPILQN